METLIRELAALRSAPSITSQQLVGAVLALAARVDEAMDERMVGIQAFAMAVAMQPGIDAKRLNDDFLAILESQFEAAGRIPPDLRDMLSAVRVATADRR